MQKQQNNLKSLILFPLNLWVWVATIPFRIFLYVVFGDFWRWSAKSKIDLKSETQTQIPQTFERKQPQLQKKQEARYPSFITPEIPLKSKATQRKTETKQKLKERYPGFIAADVPVESKEEEQRSSLFSDEVKSNAEYEFYETTPKLEERKQRSREIEQQPESIKVNTSQVPTEDIRKGQLSALQGRINELEQHERDLLDTNARLEEELSKTSKLRATDNERFTEIRLALDVNQRKCFDYGQEIIALKNQLEQQQRFYAELDAKYQAIHDKQKQKKKTQRKKKSSSVLQSTQSTQTQGKQAEVEAPQNVWGKHDHTKDFTKMVEEAQKEETAHSKPFSEVAKEAIQVEAPKKQPQVESFIVIGGNMSSSHVVEKKETEPIKQVKVEPKHEAHAGKTVWGIPDHTKDFTKMVAEAQKEEHEHTKTFSEVLKEKAVVEDDEDYLVPAKEEFLVLGGSSSSQHVIETPISSK